MAMTEQELKDFVAARTQTLDDIRDAITAVRGQQWTDAAANTADVMCTAEMMFMQSHHPHDGECPLAPLWERFALNTLKLGLRAAGIPLDTPEDQSKRDAFMHDAQAFRKNAMVLLPDAPPAQKG